MTCPAGSGWNTQIWEAWLAPMAPGTRCTASSNAAATRYFFNMGFSCG